MLSVALVLFLTRGDLLLPSMAADNKLTIMASENLLHTDIYFEKYSAVRIVSIHI